MAVHGTDKTKMICFVGIARHIISKPIQQVLRTAAGAGACPPDIMKMVGHQAIGPCATGGGNGGQQDDEEDDGAQAAHAESDDRIEQTSPARQVSW